MITKNADISRTLNLKVVKCFKAIFTSKIFTENYGFYIMLLLNILNALMLIFTPVSKAEEQFKQFCDKVMTQIKKIYGFFNKQKQEEKISNHSIYKDMNNILDTNNELKNIKAINPVANKKKKKKKKIIKNAKTIFDLKSNKFAPNPDSQEINQINSDKSNFNLNKINITNNNIDNNINSNIDNIDDKKEEKEIKEEDKEQDEQKIIEKLKAKDNYDFYVYNVIKYISYSNRKRYLSGPEITSLSYKNALKIENRNKTNYYFSLLKEKNKIISIFLNDKDYNIQNVKISLFIFNFNLSITINALFFDDEAIYEINQDQGAFNLSTQILRVLYSAIISAFIGFIVEFLAFSHDNIIELRFNKDIDEAEKKVPNLIKKLKIKFIVFFIMTISFNFIFFYYITAFCAIYSKIQTHMITSSLLSFLLEMSYSLIFSLISSIIRVFSLKKENRLRHFFYIISWVISLL